MEKALERLRDEGLRLPRDIAGCAHGRLARLVRSSGYFNQKARKLKGASRAFLPPSALEERTAPSREALLGMWGIGRETADSILLYAFRKPVFVVDAYTRRFLQRLGLIGGKESYDQVQQIFHAGFPLEHELYNEMHALVVEHAKRHCRARPLCAGCPVARSCRYHLSSRRIESRRPSSA